MSAELKITSAGKQLPINSAPDYVIDVQNICKSFRRSGNKQVSYTTLKSSLLNIFRKKTRINEDINATHAVKDITLRIPKGSSVGIIGRNGSGKSTFLKLLTGIYKPDTGRISLHGRVASLIELGAGFHPDFTGRENLFLSALMYGLTKKEAEERYDEIVDFAELRHVIDEPVRTYSSGMFMRLGFSIAVHTRPDVLLVDEVLAVGDTAFISKCKDKISELHKAGTTMLLVTHDLDSVERWCDEALWLHSGEVKDRGYPRRVIDAYRQFVEKGEEQKVLAQEIVEEVVSSQIHKDPDSEIEKKLRWGSREIEITEVELLGRDGEKRRVLHPDEKATLVMKFIQHNPQSDIVFGVAIHRADGVLVYGTNTDIKRIQMPALQTRGEARFEVSRLGLLEGAYDFDVALHRSDGYPYDYHKKALSFSVRNEFPEVGLCALPGTWSFS